MSKMYGKLKLIFLFRFGRHFLQLQAAIEVLRLLETKEIFHSFQPMDYVELFAAATHQNVEVRHRFLQRVLHKVAQWKISVLLLGLMIAVPNDDEDFVSGKNLKSVMERLYAMASKGSGEFKMFDKEEKIVFSRNYAKIITRKINFLNGVSTREQQKFDDRSGSRSS